MGEMSTPPVAIDRFLDRVAREFTEEERAKWVGSLQNWCDALWEAGDENSRAQECCDRLLLIAKAGDPFPALFAEAARVVHLLDACKTKEF
jgi:hypothetical protein